MADRKVKLGVIGCGGVAQCAHLPAILRTEKLELVAIADAFEDQAKGVAKKFGIGEANGYGDYKDVLARDDVEAVSVLVLTHLHADFVIEALRAGKHVLVEKPMAVTAEEARAMIAAQEETGKQLMIACNHTYDVAVDYVKELIDNGELGKLLYAEAFFYEDNGAWHAGQFKNLVRTSQERIPWKQYEEPFEQLREYIHNFDSHVTNMMRYLIGEPKGIEYAKWIPGSGMWAILDYGTFKTFFKNVHTKQRRFEKGLELCGDKKRVRLFLAPPFEPGEPGKVEITNAETQEITTPLLEYQWPFDNEYMHFAECILEGKEPRTHGRQALPDVELAEELARMAVAAG